MKKSLLEELHRIHELTYGKKILVEDNLLDKILNNCVIISLGDIGWYHNYIIFFGYIWSHIFGLI